MKENNNSLLGEKLTKGLPPTLTHVTTFSKLIALFLFILMPFAGFQLGMMYQEKLDSFPLHQLYELQINSLSPTPVLSDTNHKTCISNLDCSKGEVCQVAGPIAQGVKTQKRCYSKNEPLPLIKNERK